REPGMDRSLGVVLVRDRRAEHGHHRVADVLVDGALVALDLPGEHTEIAPAEPGCARRTTPKELPRTPRSSSGSSFSASGVEPERSAKRMVTTLRCSRSASAVSAVTCNDALVVAAVGWAAWAAAIGVPHFAQKRSFARMAAPQFAQVALVLVVRSGIGVQGTSAGP